MPPERLRELWAVGEVGLDARIKQVRGVLAMLHAANQSAFRSYLIPFENLGEGLAVGKLPVMGVCSLEEAMEYVNASAQEQERMRRDAEDRWQSQAKGRMEKEKKTPDFALLCGMEEAKRAAMIAAAGAHNLLFGRTARHRKDDACEMPAGNPAAHERGRKAGGVCNLQRGRAAGGWKADSGATVYQPASYGICLCNDRRRRCPKTGNGDVGAPGRVVLDEMTEFKTTDAGRSAAADGRGKDFSCPEPGKLCVSGGFYAVRSDESMPLRILSGQKPLQMSGLGGAPVFGETFSTASRPDGFMLSDQTDAVSKAVGKKRSFLYR